MSGKILHFLFEVQFHCQRFVRQPDYYLSAFVLSQSELLEHERRKKKNRPFSLFSFLSVSPHSPILQEDRPHRQVDVVTQLVCSGTFNEAL